MYNSLICYWSAICPIDMVLSDEYRGALERIIENAILSVCDLREKAMILLMASKLSYIRKKERG
jgi:hypothetical protein